MVSMSDGVYRTFRLLSRMVSGLARRLLVELMVV